MKIYALKGPSTADYTSEQLREGQEFLTASITAGVSRFGWSYVETADLTKLRHKLLGEMNPKERECWAKANFLLGVEPGDWVVHINLPTWGMCLAGRVVEGYSFEQNQVWAGDYRHILKLDKDSVVKFDRNHQAVLPIIKSRLKLPGGHWTISFQDEFLQTISNLKDKNFVISNRESDGTFYLRKELAPLLKDITKKIQKNHPRGELETFMAAVLRGVPGVKDVREHGQHKGWGSDDGADLVVTYCSGLPISTALEREETLVVQVKSYVDEHWETNAVNQIETAIKKFNANAGLIISTAESTDALERAIDELTTRLGKSEPEGGLNKQIPIGLIAGEDVAKLVLKYAGAILLGPEEN